MDVSGNKKGGTIQSKAQNYNLAAGTYNANSSSGKGGNIDITGNFVNLHSASVTSKGRVSGGKARIGGEYLGGKTLPSTTKKEYEGFIARYESQEKIQNSKHTVVQSTAEIDVSSSDGRGGTAIVWSDEVTDFSGSINANGSSKEHPVIG